MTYSPRRILFIITLFGLLLGIAYGPQFATAGHAQIGTARAAHVDPATCRYARYDGHHGWSRTEVAKTIRCAVERWPVPGGKATALAIARCESGLFYKAVSSSGTYLGVYQQSRTYWPSRYRAFSPDRFDLKPSPLNGRSNVVVSVKMAHASGWGAWGCA